MQQYPSCIGKKITVLPAKNQKKVQAWRGQVYTLKQKIRDDLLMSDDDKRDINNKIAAVQKLIDKEFFDVFNSNMDGVDDNLAGVDNLVASAQQDLMSATNKMERARDHAASARNMAEEAIQNKKK